ncbi:phasin family protein [Rhodoferax sp. TBRC 17660]|uniref:Phasin family protein n=1 Tax=Rhodoferax potami TaxID=3068338 RepID=A0ABU3KPT9_9BURK|nr:phasin family protein [Rhodoferax sp. TBRC 17660]MDT7519343.1 phasin family protein [Rhodoferax sp. TBRC 17660]
MVKKIQKNKPAPAAGSPLSASVKDSAQQIWQAGLGAFTRAQAEGSKAFEALVKEGVSIQRKTQAAAEDKINEATAKMSTMATDISSKATGQWDKLENIFEERVAKALHKLGVPSAKEVTSLIERIDALNHAVQQLSAQPKSSTGKAASSSPATPLKKKAAAKKVTAPAATSKPAPPRKHALHAQLPKKRPPLRPLPRPANKYHPATRLKERGRASALFHVRPPVAAQH